MAEINGQLSSRVPPLVEKVRHCDPQADDYPTFVATQVDHQREGDHQQTRQGQEEVMGAGIVGVFDGRGQAQLKADQHGYRVEADDLQFVDAEEQRQYRGRTVDDEYRSVVRADPATEKGGQRSGANERAEHAATGDGTARRAG